MKVKELISRVDKFRVELDEHFELWQQSLEQPLPDYPTKNISKLRDQSSSLARQLGTCSLTISRENSS